MLSWDSAKLFILSLLSARITLKYIFVLNSELPEKYGSLIISILDPFTTAPILKIMNLGDIYDSFHSPILIC